MAGAPRWKLYREDGEYIAACKYPEDAAALVAILPEGSTVRDGHRFTVWVEGKEAFPAAESYDRAASVMRERASRTYIRQISRVEPRP